MIIEFEIDEKELQRLVKDKIVEEMAQRILSERGSYDKNVYKRALREVVDDVCLQKRDEYFDLVVEKTADKIARKAMKDKIKELGL